MKTIQHNSNELIIRDCGLTGYAEILSLQLQLLADRQADKIPNTILLVEHPPVITLGARKSENKLLADEITLKNKGIEIITIGRGGGTTAHNPGQLVIYPIVKLKTLKLDVPQFVRLVEQLGLELLDKSGVIAHRQKGLPGLWVGKEKIASVGIQIKKWVTMHGIAVNICNDLTIFDYIVPCGLENVKMTSAVEQTGKQYNMQDIKKTAAQLCGQLFR
ncbi:MAG: lipoyl(octanoyl) transferase LipB [Planctomycetes bacterium]|nr:lipoyl(octanoyl) transferase LipB [Planctomycetota bacterium]